MTEHILYQWVDSPPLLFVVYEIHFMQTLPFISLCQSKVKVLGRDPQIQARKQNRPNSRIYVRTEEGEGGDSFGGGVMAMERGGG